MLEEKLLLTVTINLDSNMVEIHWKGIAERSKAMDYVQHLKDVTFKELASLEGFRSAKILKREISEGIEFLIVTQWENIGSIAQFSGSDINIAVVPESVKTIMIRYDKKVQHYIVESVFAND